MKLNNTNIYIFLIFAGFAALLYFFNPAQFGFYPRCLFYSSTGFQCPGCGGLRATYSLLHGNIFESLQQNFLAVIALPFLFTEMLFPINKFKLTSYFNTSLGIIILSVFIFLFTVLRNIF